MIVGYHWYVMVPLLALMPFVVGRETIIGKALQRDRDQRYQSAYEMLTDLELYLYSDRYGPTNEKLAVYLADIFPPERLGTNPSVPTHIQART